MRWRRRGRDDRGLAIVEYALLVAVLTVPVLKGTQAVMDQGRDTMERSIGGVETGEQLSGDGATTTTTAGGGGGGGGSSSSTSSTVGGGGGSSSSTSSTVVTGSSVISVRSTSTDRYRWDDRGYWRLSGVGVRLLNEAGTGVGGATVTIRLTPNRGDAVTITCTTSSGYGLGTCTAMQTQDREFRTGGENEVDWVDVQIISVSGGTPPWDGTAPSAQRVYQPSS